MAVIKFGTMLEHLQSPHSLLRKLLCGQEGLHYSDMQYMPLQCMLCMPHMPYTYFMNLIHKSDFQLVHTIMADASKTTALLLVLMLDASLTLIKYVHIGLVVCHAGCQLYELNSIPSFIQSIDEDLKRTREEQAACSGPSKVCSYCMFIANFGGLMVVPTDLPYFLMYPNINSTTVPSKDRYHFNIQGGPPGLHIFGCICCTLLQHTNLSEAHR